MGRSTPAGGCRKFRKIVSRVTVFERTTTTMHGDTLDDMSQPPSPRIQLMNAENYREEYANSVQIRISVWDFLLVFGKIAQSAPDSLTIHNSTGVYMSPQQSKALLNL